MGSVNGINELIRPSLTKNDVIDLILRQYGLQVTCCEQLAGYDDRNYKIKVDGEFDNPHIQTIHPHGYVFKVHNSLDSMNSQLIEGQHALMFHLGKDDFNVPKPVKNKSGRYYSCESFNKNTGENTPKHIIRLLEYQVGVILNEVKPNYKLYKNVGHLTAKVDESLKNIHHNAFDSHNSVWKLQNAAEIKRYFYVIEDINKRNLIQKFISDFEDKVLPEMSNLEWGIIHGDINEHNILVDGTDVIGLIDFGDATFSAYLFEAATALCYTLIHSNDIKYGKSFLEGYQEVRKLSKLELSLLKICVCTRLCQSLVLGAYSAQQDPANKYILSSQKFGWTILENISSLEDDELFLLWIGDSK